jgi:hypothetical protein
MTDNTQKIIEQTDKINSIIADRISNLSRDKRNEDFEKFFQENKIKQFIEQREYKLPDNTIENLDNFYIHHVETHKEDTEKPLEYNVLNKNQVKPNALLVFDKVKSYNIQEIKNNSDLQNKRTIILELLQDLKKLRCYAYICNIRSIIESVRNTNKTVQNTSTKLSAYVPPPLNIPYTNTDYSPSSLASYRSVNDELSTEYTQSQSQSGSPRSNRNIQYSENTTFDRLEKILKTITTEFSFNKEYIEIVDKCCEIIESTIIVNSAPI